MASFHFPVEVRFGSCDPVGIVYFPCFFDWFHEAMEAWFGAALGRPYAEVLRRQGFPAVHTECDYQRPCAFGDRIVIALSVGHVGRSSVRLDYIVHAHGDPEDVRARGHTVVVCMGTDPTAADHLQPIPLPDDLRADILAFQAAQS